MQRWKIVLPAASICIASVGLWSAIAPAPARPYFAKASNESPVVSTTSSTTTSEATTTTNAANTAVDTEVLPVRAQVPTDPRADVAIVEIGRISIPKIGLDHLVYEGVWLTVIDVGPGHWPGTPLPGGYGNSVFGGHRVTKSHPFMDLDLLDIGDAIIFTLRDGTTAEYRMTEQLIVEPEDMWIADQTPGRTLTLFACHPKGSARQRIVIKAELIPVAI